MGEGFQILRNASAIAFIILVINATLTLATPPLSGLGEHGNYHRQRIAFTPGYRLDRAVVPIHYDCELWVILDNDTTVGEQFTAPGKVKILVEADENRNRSSITLHSVGITIHNVTVTQDGNSENIHSSYTQDKDKQFLILSMGRTLTPKARYNIEINFVTPIEPGSTTQFGLYRSSYIRDDGVERFMAVTDFESVDARRMVPCFDEPDMKATWKMSVVRQEPYASLSNMNLTKTEDTDKTNWKRDIYETTVKMPTYLLALTVSDYVSETAPAADFNKPVKVWGPPPLMNAPNNGGKYAAEFSGKLMDFFEKYLSVPYTLPKMDEFAIPQFSAGAMENWGLNTYRIVRLIWIEGSSTIQEKVAMTNTIAHELAHQWFGDLVTMKWWDDIWLNEGFATYFANLAVSSATNPKIYPEYGFNDYVVVDSVQYAMLADVRGTTHPLHYANLSTPAETRYGFDTISYDKGASILRMINAFLTQDLFVKGLQQYLANHQLGNAEQEELFTALQVAGVDARLPVNVNLNVILRTWTTQAGFPLIRVTRTATEVKITQEPFVNDTANSNPSSAKWYVPITYQTTSKPYDPAAVPEWLLPGDASKTLPAVNANEFIILNPEQTSYYRVMYEKSNLDLILTALNSDPLPLDPKTRSALTDDNLNLAFNGYQNIATGLDFTKYLKNEIELVPWATFVTNMARSYRLLSRTGAFYYYRKYVRNLMKPTLVDKIKLEPQVNDGTNVANTYLLRNRLFEWSCNLGGEECVAYSKDLVTTWMNDANQAIPASLKTQPDLRPFVYCTAVANADNVDKDKVSAFILEQFQKSTAETDKLSLVKALACSKETNKLKELLNMAVNISDSTFADYRVVAMQAVAGNTAGPELVLNYLQENIKGVIAAGTATMVSSVITTLSNYISTQTELETINRFIQTNRAQLNSVIASLETSTKNIEDNIKWTETFYTDMRNWLSSNYAV